MSAKKIAMLLPDLRGGGAERVAVDLARALKKNGHNVEFVLLKKDGEFLMEVTNEFDITDLGADKVRQALLPLISYLRYRKPDVLIANMWPITTVAVISRILSRNRTILILVEHITLSMQYASWGIINNLIMRLSIFLTYRCANHIASVSAGSARDLARLAGLNKNRVSVLYNPIPIRTQPTFDAIYEAEQIWNCQPINRILTVGSLKDQKNHSLLIQAFAGLSKLDARLMIVGKGDQSILRKLAIDLGVSERVIFAGFHNDPSPFYATANLFVLSSDYEGFGNVIVEALSFGLPVVSTNCPHGPAEILEDGLWGWLVPVGDSSTLKSTIDIALSTPVDTVALMRRADDFSPNIVAKNYMKLMDLK